MDNLQVNDHTRHTIPKPLYHRTWIGSYLPECVGKFLQ
jgi:hypothetical protein